MHLIELRSQPQGHASYRRVAQLMHDAIRDVAGHHHIADMMSFVDHSDSDVGRSPRNADHGARRGALELMTRSDNSATLER
ncbi:MAG: hypothetical protein R2878_02250 [Thermoleophilia bacterium]